MGFTGCGTLGVLEIVFRYVKAGWIICDKSDLLIILNHDISIKMIFEERDFLKTMKSVPLAGSALPKKVLRNKSQEKLRTKFHSRNFKR
ncbi:hypothetical protein ACR79Q_09930 [Sphingobacterium multivorum]|uniref:hypothetical protein n=1 Tax=Sphingobacterium multivorum TaxID=28454 RepID=UPI003DA4D722